MSNETEKQMPVEQPRLVLRLQAAVAHMDSHQREREHCKLLIESLVAIKAFQEGFNLDGSTAVEACCEEIKAELRRERDACRPWVEWCAKEWEHRGYAHWPAALLSAARALKIIPKNDKNAGDPPTRTSTEANQ